MSALVIRPCGSIDCPGWLELRSRLWPQHGTREHGAEMAAFLAEPGRFAQFVAYEKDEPVGLVEASVRSDYVNGTSTSPVAFLEGIYVTPEARRRGIARALVEALAAWARERGCRELASDALLENATGHAMHRVLGFTETERVVYFRKSLE